MKQMNHHKHDIRMYNMILPPFLLFALPMMWPITLIGNFIIDSLVLIVILLIVFKKVSGKQYGKTIWKVWLLGFAADFIGIIPLVVLWLTLDPIWFSESAQAQGVLYAISSGMYMAINHSDCFYNIWGFLYVFGGILIAAVAIFLFDYFIALRKCGFTKRQKLFASLAFAVFTAPYTLMLPVYQFLMAIGI